MDSLRSVQSDRSPYAEGFDVLRRTNRLSLRPISRAAKLPLTFPFTAFRRFEVYGDDAKRPAFYAAEHVRSQYWCTHALLGPARRPFSLLITGPAGQPFLRLQRPLRCTCLCIAPQCVSVYDCSTGGDEVLLGKLTEEFTMCGPRFSVADQRGSSTLTLNGGVCVYQPLESSYVFEVDSETNEHIADVRKHWSGMCRREFADSGLTFITFEAGSEQQRALVLACAFFAHFLYLEGGRVLPCFR